MIEDQEEEHIYFLLVTQGDLEFLVEHRRREKLDLNSDEDHSLVRFWMEEHTCPTNWLGNVLEVWHKGERDPHGTFRLKNIVEAPKNWDFYNHQEQDDAMDLVELGLKK